MSRTAAPSKKQLAIAYSKARQVTGFKTGDETQCCVENFIFAFVKDGKTWKLIDAEPVRAERALKPRIKS